MTAPRRIGDRLVSPVGFGAAGLSLPEPPDPSDSVRVLHTALDAGVTLIDTAACYVPSHRSPGHNEAIIAKALAEWGGDPDDVLVATKCGITRIAEGGTLLTDFKNSGTPSALRAACDISLAALGVDRVGLMQLHSPPEDVPFLDAVGTLAELQREGKVAMVGLCNVTVEQLDQAREVVDVVSVQNRLSPGQRGALDVVAACEERGIAFLAYSPLGGLGAVARQLGDQNAAFAEVALARGVSAQQVALAWELTLSPVVLPIPGSRRVETAADSAAAVHLELTADELTRLGAA